MIKGEKDFVNFKVHTQYSICEGAIKIQELAGYCKKNKIKAIGLSDTYKISSNGGKPKKLAETPNRNANIISVSANNNYVFVSDANRTKSEIYKI